jgi:hypothetical protein
VENGQKRLLVPQGKLRQALVAGHLGFNKAYKRLRQGVTYGIHVPFGGLPLSAVAIWPKERYRHFLVEYGSVTLLSQVLSIRVMLEILVETTA